VGVCDPLQEHFAPVLDTGVEDIAIVEEQQEFSNDSM